LTKVSRVMPLIVGVVLSRALAFVALEAFIRVKHAYQCPGASTEAASTVWASVQECSLSDASASAPDREHEQDGADQKPDQRVALARMPAADQLEDDAEYSESAQ